MSNDTRTSSWTSSWTSSLTAHERHFFAKMFTFFATAGASVLNVPEDAHSIHDLLNDPLLNDHTRVPFEAHAKIEWAMHALDSSRHTFPERLVALACVQGLFFSGSLCVVRWLDSKGKAAPSLVLATRMMTEEKALHTSGACEEYARLDPREKLTTRCVTTLVKEAVSIERQFVRDVVPVGLIGMNPDALAKHVEFRADALLEALGYAKMFYVTNPFSKLD